MYNMYDCVLTYWIHMKYIFILISSRVSAKSLRSLQFPKSLPVRVMPPMKSPSTAAMFSMLAPASGVCTKEPMEVPGWLHHPQRLENSSEYMAIYGYLSMKIWL